MIPAIFNQVLCVFFTKVLRSQEITGIYGRFESLREKYPVNINVMNRISFELGMNMEDLRGARQPQDWTRICRWKDVLPSQIWTIRPKIMLIIFVQTKCPLSHVFFWFFSKAKTFVYKSLELREHPQETCIFRINMLFSAYIMLFYLLRVIFSCYSVNDASR